MKNNLLKEIKAIWREYEEHYVLCRIISILYQKIFTAVLNTGGL